jgi:hypothetical protein
MRAQTLILGACVSLLLRLPASGAAPKFYADDPLAHEPETQNASGTAARDIDLIWDLALNLLTRPGDRARDVRALNVNTIDEVPDSSWFTNRILAAPLSIDALTRGPLTGSGPAPGVWLLTHPKESGFAPGFRIRDTKGEVWFVSLDPKGFDEAATGALAVANKIFWALGYWQVENFIVRFKAGDVTVASTSRMHVPSGSERPMTRADFEAVLARAAREPDGRYRAVAARGLPGKILGGFDYHGTRPDDPNDIVPHEHRRELRALRVFGAWTNLVDMKAGNTLDTVLTRDDGTSVVRHYLQDVGSTFGTGANGPREFDEGWESLVNGRYTLMRLITLGFFIQPWQTVRYAESPAIGRFEGDRFDPLTWSPRVPPAAFYRARPDDTFWAARRVMAFTDDLIRAVVHTGEYSRPSDESQLADALIKRRNAIGRAYLPAVTPLADFALTADGQLTFTNVARQAGVEAPSEGYRARWYRFDNATSTATPLGAEASTTRETLAAPEGLPLDAGSYVKVQIWASDRAHSAWSRPIDVYFRRANGNTWTLVGLERLP